MEYEIQISKGDALKNREVFFTSPDSTINVDILRKGREFRLRQNRNPILRTKSWREVVTRLHELISTHQLHLVLEDGSTRMLEPVVKNENSYKPVVWENENP